jgi:prepilin-type N-terminal cleavage/methylation domain-containing protein
MRSCLDADHRAARAVNGMPRLRGFTVLEMTIVLVIAALLLAGVLQGRSMLQSMQVKNTMAIAADLTTAARTFRERYHYLPGDLPVSPAPNAEIPNLTGACAAGGNGDGIIKVSQASGPATLTESTCAIAHLLNAGLIRAGGGYVQSHYGAVRMVGNSIAAGSVTAAGTNPVPSTIVNLVEFDNLPCDVALEIDLKLDDGDLATGNVRASVASCTAGSSGTIVPTLAVPL